MGSTPWKREPKVRFPLATGCFGRDRSGFAVAEGLDPVVGGKDGGKLAAEEVANVRGKVLLHRCLVGFPGNILSLFRGGEQGVIATA